MWIHQNTTCCAPVLAGILVLSALTASPFEALLIGFTYVAGMVFPLVLIAMFWDKYSLNSTNLLRGRMVYLNIMKREFSIHSSKLIAGMMFISMGLVTVGLGVTRTMIPMPGTALVAVLQATLQASIVDFFSDTLSSVGVLAFGALTVATGLYISRVRQHQATSSK